MVYIVCCCQIYHSKSGSGEINPERIRTYVQAYVDKIRQSKKYAARKGKDD